MDGHATIHIAKRAGKVQSLIDMLGITEEDIESRPAAPFTDPDRLWRQVSPGRWEFRRDWLKIIDSETMQYDESTA